MTTSPSELGDDLTLPASIHRRRSRYSLRETIAQLPVGGTMFLPFPADRDNFHSWRMSIYGCATRLFGKQKLSAVERIVHGQRGVRIWRHE